MSRRILVTGATTPIGRKTVEMLLADDSVEHVIAAGIESDPFGSSDRLTYVTANLARPRSMHNLMFGEVRKLAPDTIVHLALHRSARTEGERIHALNVDATRELLRMAERHPSIDRFVFRSFADVYQIRPDRPTIIGEDHPIALDVNAPQWVRDRLEADLIVCTAMGLSPLSIAVLRMAECVAPDSGSQLFDYLGSRVCLRPAGFDPMLNVISVDDAARALVLAAKSDVTGVLNVPGKDTLPLSRFIALAGRRAIPTPGPVVAPLYGLRARIKGTEFRYDLNERRFHLGAVLDGRRAARDLGYIPSTSIRFENGASHRTDGTDR